MSVTVHLHRTQRCFARGLEAVNVRGATVGQCLEDLVRRHPALRDKIFDSSGKLRRTIEIYLNLESAFPDELLKPTADGDCIHVTMLLTGG